MESKAHQMNWFQNGKCSFYFWNQFRILVHSNPQKSPPLKLKSSPKSSKSHNRLLNALNRPLGTISPTLNITGVQDDFLDALCVDP